MYPWQLVDWAFIVSRVVKFINLRVNIRSRKAHLYCDFIKRHLFCSHNNVFIIFDLHSSKMVNKLTLRCKSQRIFSPFRFWKSIGIRNSGILLSLFYELSLSAKPLLQREEPPRGHQQFFWKKLFSLKLVFFWLLICCLILCFPLCLMDFWSARITNVNLDHWWLRIC